MGNTRLGAAPVTHEGTIRWEPGGQLVVAGTPTPTPPSAFSARHQHGQPGAPCPQRPPARKPSHRREKIFVSPPPPPTFGMRDLLHASSRAPPGQRDRPGLGSSGTRAATSGKQEPAVEIARSPRSSEDQGVPGVERLGRGRMARQHAPDPQIGPPRSPASRPARWGRPRASSRNSSLGQRRVDR